MKTSKQSGRVAQIVIFLAILILCCLSALGILIAVTSFKGYIKLPFKQETPTSTATVRPSWTTSPSLTLIVSLTPLPGQWTGTPSPLPGQPTQTLTTTPLRP